MGSTQVLGLCDGGAPFSLSYWPEATYGSLSCDPSSRTTSFTRAGDPSKVNPRDNSALDPIIHGLKGVVHHEKETFLDPFILRDLLPASLGSYYRYTGSLTTPPCSEIVEWIIFRKPVPISYHQLEAFYSIFTTEQQDHVKSVEYLRNNFRPQQALNDRVVSKSAVRDAWSHDMADFLENPLGTEASKVEEKEKELTAVERAAVLELIQPQENHAALRGGAALCPHRLLSPTLLSALTLGTEYQTWPEYQTSAPLAILAPVLRP
ncbi:Receptor-type tyrosine-protein phosphatase gamma [Fukomys damarensis]|uniref:Receptor-type tyrosine-protein phosphatase gamma n=1 Tax=Fukomys damarensis TaxID=885580 RepID=A0A091CZJ6_FUKDA|nr:Receptor-type tyrosine-protein phosphatase gamma [Fukomys damarensis]